MNDAAQAVRRLVPADTERCVRLRQEALLDSPFSFLSSPEDDFGSDPERVRASLADTRSGATFGAFAEAGGEAALVGCVGIGRERHRKAAHKATVWGLYVTPSARRRGLARALMQAVLAFAREMPEVRQVRLGVAETAEPALRLYQGLGFRRWGTEPEAIRHAGRSVDEHHLVLHLERRGTGLGRPPPSGILRHPA